MIFDMLSIAIATGEPVSSDSLDARLGLPVGTVAQTTGVITRPVVPPHISQSAFAASALKKCGQLANIPLDNLDLLISTSAVPEQAIPSTACFVAYELGLTGVPAFDINASCLGFLVSLHTAISLLHSQNYRRIGLVASDIASRGLNWQQLHASGIFGDGSAAVILQLPTDTPPSTSSETATRLNCLAYAMQTYPEGRHDCQIRAGGTRANATVGMEPSDFLFDMNGKAVFRLAMTHSERFVGELLAKANLSYDDIDCVIMHQASHLGMKHAIARMKFRPDTIIDIYATHGNQVSASIPTVLYHAHRQGKICTGNKVILLGTAAGFSIGGMILEVL